MQLSGFLVLDQVNFSEGALADEFDDLEVFKEQDIFVGLFLEETLSPLSALALDEFFIILHDRCKAFLDGALSMIHVFLELIIAALRHPRLFTSGIVRLFLLNEVFVEDTSQSKRNSAIAFLHILIGGHKVVE